VTRFHDIAAKCLALLIVLCAFIVRFWGIDFGLPYVGAYWDEHEIVNSGLTIIKTGDLNPYSPYPSVAVYLQTGVYLLYLAYGKFAGLFSSIFDVQFNRFYPWEINFPGFYYWGRFLTVVLGTLTVYLAYRIGAKMFDRRVGLLASLILAFTIGHVENSRVISIHVPAAFVDALAFFVFLYLYQQRRLRIYLLSGLLIGFATATAYNSFLIVLPFLLIHYLTRPEGEGPLSRNLVIGLACIPAGFFIGYPFSLIDFGFFYNKLLYTLNVYYYGQLERTQGLNTWADYAYFVSKNWITPAPALAFLAGSVWGLARYFKRAALLLLFPVALYALMSLQSTVAHRNLIPIFVFVAIVIAAFITDMVDLIARRLNLNRPAQIVALSILALVVLARPISMLYDNPYLGLQKVDTRTEIVHWMITNIEPGARIALISELRFHPIEIEILKKKFRVSIHRQLEKGPQDYINERFAYVIAPSYRFTRWDREERLKDYFQPFELVHSSGREYIMASAFYFPIIYPIVKVYRVPSDGILQTSSEDRKLFPIKESTGEAQTGDERAPSTHNLIENPGFEYESFHWNLSDNSTIETDAPQSGKYFLRLRGRGETVWTIQFIPITAGKRYVFSTYYRTGSEQGGFVRLSFYPNFDRPNLQPVLWLERRERGWTKFEIEFDAPGEASYIRIECGAPGSSVVDFDQLYLNLRAPDGPRR